MFSNRNCGVFSFVSELVRVRKKMAKAKVKKKQIKKPNSTKKSNPVDSSDIRQADRDNDSFLIEPQDKKQHEGSNETQFLSEKGEAINKRSTIFGVLNFFGTLIFLAMSFVVVIGVVYWPNLQDIIDSYIGVVARSATAQENLRPLKKEFGNLRETNDALAYEVDILKKFHTQRERSLASMNNLLQRVDELEKQQEEISAIIRSGLTSELALESIRSLNKIKASLRTLATKENISELETRMDKLESISDVEKHLDQRSFKALSSDIEKRIVQLEDEKESVNLVFAVTQFRDAVFSGRTFLVESKILRNIGADVDAVEVCVEALEPYAKSGIQTIPVLRKKFLQFAEKIAPKLQKGKNSWFSNIKKQLFSLVSIRRIEEIGTPKTVYDGVVLIKQLLQRDELHRAVFVLEGLFERIDPISLQKIEPWLASARIRIMAEQKIRDVYMDILTLFESKSEQ